MKELRLKHCFCLLLLLIVFIGTAGCSKASPSSPEETAKHTAAITPGRIPDISDIPFSTEENTNSVIPESASQSKSDIGTDAIESDSMNKPDEQNKEPDLSPSQNDNQRIIAIDAGHQSKGNYNKEPIGPGAGTSKAKVSSGTQGSYTGVPEYKLNLEVSKKISDELEARGYLVVMIRETHDVNLSNKERADIANESGADIFIRIHADGSDNPEVNGASALYPSEDNPYVADLSDSSYSLSKAIIDSLCDHTGAKNRGAIPRDDMSGINWCKIPVTIIEMGYMTNEIEDKLMQTDEYQDKIVQGICDGIKFYFE